MRFTVNPNFPLRAWFSPSTLGLRLAIGITIFTILALRDLHLHGRQARRWREYAFLASIVLAALAYGAANDQLSSRISWEYFYYGKELYNSLGPKTPPDRAALCWQAAGVGMKATWSVGLVLGVALLMANNPRRDRPWLAPMHLWRFVPIVLVSAIVCSAIGAAFGWFGYLNWLSSDFSELAESDLWRPRHFMACFGEHLGGYVGGLIGAIAAGIAVFRSR